jgi:hypothetical protein
VEVRKTQNGRKMLGMLLYRNAQHPVRLSKLRC